jgi:S1-C subfamily serine protease
MTTTRPVVVSTTLTLAVLTLTYCPASERPTVTSALVQASAVGSAVAPHSAEFDRVQVGVVMLFASPRPREMSAGTAIVVNAHGVALTNAHVVRDARVIVAHSGDGAHGARNYPVTALGSDDLHDIAVIQLAGSAIAAAELGNSDTVRVGQPVAAVGNVGGSGTATTSTGVITGLGRRVVSLDARGGIPNGCAT